MTIAISKKRISQSTRRLSKALKRGLQSFFCRPPQNSSKTSTSSSAHTLIDPSSSFVFERHNDLPSSVSPSIVVANTTIPSSVIYHPSLVPELANSELTTIRHVPATHPLLNSSYPSTLRSFDTSYYHDCSFDNVSLVGVYQNTVNSFKLLDHSPQQPNLVYLDHELNSDHGMLEPDPQFPHFNSSVHFYNSKTQLTEYYEARLAALAHQYFTELSHLQRERDALAQELANIHRDRHSHSLNDDACSELSSTPTETPKTSRRLRLNSNPARMHPRQDTDHDKKWHVHSRSQFEHLKRSISNIHMLAAQVHPRADLLNLMLVADQIVHETTTILNYAKLDHCTVVASRLLGSWDTDCAAILKITQSCRVLADYAGGDPKLGACASSISDAAAVQLAGWVHVILVAVMQIDALIVV